MSDNHKLEILQESAESKQQLAYQQLRNDILNNIYPEGTVLTERKLCEIYSVSRSPIRNALQQLTHEGLLSLIPGKGATVVGFSIEDILEVYDLIEMMQLHALQALEGHIDEAFLLGLTELLSHMQQTSQAGDIAASTKWDQQFHHFLITAAGSRRLASMYEQLHMQSIRFMATSAKDDAALAARSCQEHAQICACIQAGDLAGAGQGLREHYRNIRQYYIDRLIHRGSGCSSL
ncbi:MAG: GntR family transcriptional regulator [Lachnospiraceae bacterium]|nr:GntR family transcriptional regulator [Lachnospiraceae bacterium]